MAEEDEIRTTLRLSAALRDRVAKAAKDAGRSVNSYIVFALEETLSEHLLMPALKEDIRVLREENASLRKQMGLADQDPSDLTKHPPLTTELLDEVLNDRIQASIDAGLRSYREKLERLESVISERLGVTLDLDLDQDDDE